MRQSPWVRWGRILLTLIAFGGTMASGIRAQDVGKGSEGPRFLVALAGRGKPVPTEPSRVPILASRVSLAVDNVPLTQALAMISRQTSVEFVYGPDAVESNRRVSLHAADITLAAALTEVLFGAGVDVLLSAGRHQATLVPRVEAGFVAPVGAITGRVTDAKTQSALAGATVVVQGTSRSATTGSDGRYRIANVAPGTYTVRARYIGYAPGTTSVTVSADQEATADFTLEKSAQRLDEVVTTGTVVPTEVKALPTPISVITADDIQRQNLQRVDQLFRGEVPGVIAWNQDPANDYNSSVLVRGTSTIGGSPTIKTFIDGVEVADPSFIAGIDPNSIDRIEITRGPQASTLYGAGALDGVLQVFTKKGQLGLSRPEVMGKLSAGGVGGLDGQSSAFQTDNALSVLGGGEKTGYNIGGSYRHTGAWAPSYNSTDWGISVGGQTTQGPFTLSSSARYVDRWSQQPWNTQLQAYTTFSKPPDRLNRIRQQTYGLSASLQATRSWQHTLTLGYDQSYLSSDPTQPRFTTPADSFVYVIELHEPKLSVLYHTDLNVTLGTDVAVMATTGVNYTTTGYLDSFTGGATHTTGNLDGSTFLTNTPGTNTGYFGQVQVGLADRLFLTGGIRAERNSNFGTNFGTAWSPRAGAAYVLGLGRATVKLRASYGEGIRAPSPGARDARQFPGCCQYLANPALAPERQRGVDGGVEVYIGQALLSMTYYNQRAIDLIQLVSIATAPGSLPTYQNQNIARVKNEGWEFEGRLPLGPVQLAGTYSITHSTVQELPPGYPPGGYQVGDQILEVPRTSAGASITYSPLPRTTLMASMTHIGHWIQEDVLALYGFYFGGQPYRGSDRAYWMQYPTVTKFAVGASQRLAKDLTAFVRAENVGNNLRYERNNFFLTTPRSILLGANVRY